MVQWFAAHRLRWLTDAAMALSALHSSGAVLCAAAVVAAGLARRNQPHWLPALAAAVPGGMLVNAALKLLVQRARPSLDGPLMRLATFSFPSGHATAAALFHRFLAVLVFAHTRSRAHAPTRSRRLRSSVAAGCAGMVLLVAASRVYLGVHYLSDGWPASRSAPRGSPPCCWFSAAARGLSGRLL